MIGVIADDLTGAAEIGAVGLRHGLRAEVLIAGSARQSRRAQARTPNVDLICVDTDSRSCPAAEAARRVVDAVKLLRRAGAEWIYKKVDSVLRGRIVAETEAMARALGCRRILLHPANPSLGRTIRDGKYFVRGRLIHRTEFARDPAYPRRTAEVRGLLGKSSVFSVHVCGLRDTLPETGIVICESASPRDVRRWAAREYEDTLFVGGSEFFAALLETRTKRHPAKATQYSRPKRERELFVCGTTSESSKKFVRSALRHGAPVFSLPGGVAWGADFTSTFAKIISGQVAAAFQSHSRVILQIGLRTVHDAPVAKRLSGYLTRLAKAVLGRSKVDGVFVEGGATAVELVRRMGWTRLKVVREVAPGVATLAVAGKKSILLTIKPGSYVWPDEIQKPAMLAAIKKLRSRKNL